MIGNYQFSAELQKQCVAAFRKLPGEDGIDPIITVPLKGESLLAAWDRLIEVAKVSALPPPPSGIDPDTIRGAKRYLLKLKIKSLLEDLKRL